MPPVRDPAAWDDDASVPDLPIANDPNPPATTRGAGDLRFDDVRKSYGDVRAVDGVNLRLGPGETIALLGPSGCGKSTLLRLAAGLELPDRGRVFRGEADITRLPPQRRSIGMVFQDYALFPHLDVARNVAFGLVELGWDVARTRARVSELLALVGLTGLERRRVDALSGGQQQRVALARALAPEPAVLLLDEPLSNLDQALREDLKDELGRILDQLAVRSIYVTHDQDEALALADRVAVMRAGRIVQVGPPRDVLERPTDAWMARFMGHENVYTGAQLRGIPGAPRSGAALLRADLTHVAVAPPPSATMGSTTLQGRPTQPIATPPGDATIHATPATVGSVRHDGLAWRLDLRLAFGDVGLPFIWHGYAREFAAAHGTTLPRAGDRLTVHVPSEAWWPLEDEGPVA